jgi:hypothetical protein
MGDEMGMEDPAMGPADPMMGPEMDPAMAEPTTFNQDGVPGAAPTPPPPPPPNPIIPIMRQMAKHQKKFMDDSGVKSEPEKWWEKYGIYL